MKRKIGRLCMVLGAVLILCAAGLLGYNRWDAARAEKASQEVLGELEQTMQKTITEHRQENETAAPQPVLDPAQEMTTVEVEGRDYIGVLSIPAAGLRTAGHGTVELRRAEGRPRTVQRHYLCR